MSPPSVVLAADDAALIRLVRAAFEEEAVPLAVVGAGTARAAAVRSPLGIGLAAGPTGLELALATGPDEPWLVDRDPRRLGRIAALREPSERRDLRAIDGQGLGGALSALAPDLRAAVLAAGLVGTVLAAGEVIAAARLEPPGWAWSSSTTAQGRRSVRRQE